MNVEASWIAVDWGTSRMRLWGMGQSDEVLFTDESESGMSQLNPSDFERVFNESVSRHLDNVGKQLDVLVCGMAGARSGWLEAPYLDLPASLQDFGSRAVSPELSDSKFRVRILPGVSQTRKNAEDVMRGEETQVLGLLADKPNFSGIACLPGTHTKWVRIANGSIEAFHTSMTGEMFQLLQENSVLRHVMSDDVIEAEMQAGFSEGLSNGIDKPEQLLSMLFRTRAVALVSDKSPSWCKGFLSGILIGTEVAGQRDFIGDLPITLIGNSRQRDLYGSALNQMDRSCAHFDVTDATLAGLALAKNTLDRLENA